MGWFTLLHQACRRVSVRRVSSEGILAQNALPASRGAVLYLSAKKEGNDGTPNLLASSDPLKLPSFKPSSGRTRLPS